MKSITYLKTSELYPNPRQPRRNFDETAMKELAASIRSVGVLQPATVRQIKGNKGYEIVCGERRWRATTEAGLKTIPCIIRELSDEEAMDVAITENLQRKDIDPFEEAQVFQYLLDKGQTFDDLAARFGKSSIFVRGRVKLNEIIEPLRTLYESKEIPVSHCLELCKLTSDLQTRIYDERYQSKVTLYNSWRNSTLREIRKGLDHYMQVLKSAPFDKTECNSCPKNTATCGLFEDLREVSCSDKECYARKNIEYRVAKIIKKHEDNPELILYAHCDTGGISQKVFAGIKDAGIPYYSDKQYFLVRGLEQPRRHKGQPDEDFAGEMEKYKERMAEAAAKIDSGEYLHAMRIDDWDFGNTVMVSPLHSGRGAEPSTPESAIADLKQKDERNNELRIEKTVEEVTRLWWDKKDEISARAPLSDLEIGLMYYLMADYDSQRNQIKYDEPVAANIDRILKTTEQERVAAARNYLYEKLPKSGHEPICEVAIELCKQYFPDDAAAIEAKHRETYERRKEKIDARITERENKKK